MIIFRHIVIVLILISIESKGQLIPNETDIESNVIKSITDFSYWKDSSGSSDIFKAMQVLSAEKFTSISADHINFGITDSVVWLAFHVDPTTKQQYLSPGNESTVWIADLFSMDSAGNYLPVGSYDHLSPRANSSNLPFRSIGMPLPQNGTGDYLLKVFSRRHRNYSLKIGNLESMSSYLIQKEIIPIAFMAFMLCIFIYNIFLYVSTRAIIFIPYLIYVLFISFGVPFHGGYVLFSKEWMWQGMPFYTVWTSIGYLSGGLFAILYLNLKSTAPGFYKAIVFLMLILVVLVPILDVFGMVAIGGMAKIVSITSLTFNLTLWGSSIFVWIKGRANARFYAIGWLFAISSMVLFILSTNGVIPYNSFVEQSFYYGFALEAVLFAFALGDRMNVLKKEKRDMATEHLQFVTNQNRVLAKQSFMNSHMLRAPLSRILGITNLLKFPLGDGESAQLIKLVEQSTIEMDGIAKKMSVMLEEHGYLDEYQQDFEEVKRSILQELNENGQSTTRQ